MSTAAECSSSSELFPGPNGLEVSVVMPCLNEADTLGACILKADTALRNHGIKGEIIVADNGSTDGSQEIAVRGGARLVHIQEKGYGNALMGGIAVAKGRFIVMGDADDSYDFGELPKFLDKLRQGFDLVQGCRFPAGGGTIEAGAMKFTHRWFGNPVFSFLVRLWFHAPVRDVYCGLRGFRKATYEALDQRCTGMEFATEMIIKASLTGARITEAPIILHRDGRKSHAPHLKTVRDGWRTLRYFLMCSPRWLFLWPGALLVAAGLAGYAVALPGVVLGGIRFDAHTLLFSTLFMICGYQSILFALFARTFAFTAGLLPANQKLLQFYQIMDLEKGLLAAGISLATGFLLLLLAINQWRLAGFGDLNYARTMRLVIPGGNFDYSGVSNLSFELLHQYPWDEAQMSWLDAIHGHCVHPRRVQVLSERFAKILPPSARVLDVGCGDGQLALLVTKKRPDLSIQGLEVLLRPGASIPVSSFDGKRIPFADGAFDVVMFSDVLHHTTDPGALLGEAARVARHSVAIKDHLRQGLLAGPTLAFMDQVGNRRHGVSLPYNYWTYDQWMVAFQKLNLRISVWEDRLRLYPFPLGLLFDRSLHFLASLTPSR